MKKILASVLAFFLLQSVAVPASAATSDDKDISVNGKYVYTAAPGVAEAELSDGKYETIVDGIPVTVTPNTPQNDLTLVLRIIPETHEEAHDWFGDVLSDYGDDLLPMDIHFVDAENNRVEFNDSVRVSMTVPEGIDSPQICFVSDEGEVTVVESTVVGGIISWTAAKHGYYVLMNKSGSHHPTTPTQPTTPTGPSSPDGPSTTGDQNQTSLWMVVLIASGVAIIVLIVFGTRKKKKDE